MHIQSFSNEVRGLIAGITKHFSKAPSISFGNLSFTPGDLTTLLKSAADASDAAKTQKVVWQNLLLIAKAEVLKARPVVALFKTYVLALYGSNVEVLTDFGLVPHKKGKTAPAALVAGATKARATRALLGTKGAAQKKKAIKGAPPVPATSSPSATPKASP